MSAIACAGVISACSDPVVPLPVEEIRLTIPRALIRVGETLQATAVPVDDAGHPLGERPITWASTNTSVAQVSDAGVITAVGPGTATISAAVEGKTADQTVTVTLVPIASVAIDPPSATVAIGQQTKLAVIVKDTAGRVVTGRSVVWKSSDPAHATVSDDGTVTGTGLGTVEITAAVETQTATAHVVVDRPPVTTAGHPLLFSSNAFTELRVDTTASAIITYRPYDIFAAKEDGTDPINITQDPETQKDPQWSPDGKQIVFIAVSGTGATSISVMREDGTQRRQLTSGDKLVASPRWTADGQRILFTSRDTDFSTRPDIFMMNADGSGVVNLTNTPETAEFYPAPSPDGQKLAFLRIDQVEEQLYPGGPLGTVTKRRIYISNADGSAPTPWRALDPDFADDAPAWSPDGTRIAFSAFYTKHMDFFENYVILVANADGSNVQRVTSLSATSRFPAWSPDGTQIFYSISSDEFWARFSTGLARIYADGSSPTLLSFIGGRHSTVGGPQAWR